jgi:acyl-CoA thioesterase I
MTPHLLAVALLAALVAAPLGAEAAAPDGCPVPVELQQIDVKLPHLAARLRTHRPVTIVAIGGASTAGAAAGAPDLAYPARLQKALAADFPSAAITVLNRGVARQTTQQMVERFPRDVIANAPVLVVWETGTVDAVRGVHLDDFAAALQDGIDLLKKQAVDIILVDMQYSHHTAAVIDFEHYLETLHGVGELDDIYVFPRFAIMRYWSEQNMFNFDGVSADKRARLAARAYDCIARRLADAIQRAVQ